MYLIVNSMKLTSLIYQSIIVTDSMMRLSNEVINKMYSNVILDILIS